MQIFSSSRSLRSVRRRAAAALPLPLLLVALAPAGAQVREREYENLEARNEYYWSMRTYPFAEPPYAAMVRAQQQAALRARAGYSVAPGGASGGWRPLGPLGLFGAELGFYGSGPQLDAGRISGMAVSPADDRTIYLATASGGVWKSQNGGVAWTPLTDNECTLNTGAVAVDPANPSIVYAGTGEFNQGSPGCGVLRSTDGGGTWTTISAPFVFASGGGQNVQSLLIDRTTAGSATSTTILAATNSALYRSTNSGQSWTPVISGRVATVIQHPTDPKVFYASGWDGNAGNPGYLTSRGLYKSVDGGATWTRLASPVSTDYPGRMELAISRSAPHLVFALIADRASNKMLGLFRWDEETQIWTKLPATGVYTGERRGDFGAQGTYDLTIAVDPDDARRVYIAGVRAFRSTDGGMTFRQMAQEIHCDWHAVIVDAKDPQRLYALTDGGFFVSQDRGDSWVSRNYGLQITQYYAGIALHPNGTQIIGGAQDNGTLRYTGSMLWDGQLPSGDGGYNIINQKDPTISYSSGYWSSGPYIYRTAITSTGMRQQAPRNAGLVTADRAQFMPPMVADPSDQYTLYFGTYRLYRTNDAQAPWGGWTPITGDLTKGTGRLTTIAVAPADPKTIYVGTTDGLVQVSRDSGVTFAPMIGGLPNRAVTRIVVDRANAQRALVTFSGYGTGHVFLTTDGGATWTNISGNLIDTPALSAVLLSDDNIMVGTDVGLFQTIDGGKTWARGPAGMPNVMVNDLVLSQKLGIVIAATFGRGMWAYALGTSTVTLKGDVNRDGKVDAFDALLVQQALVGLPSAGVLNVFPAGDVNCNGTIDAGDALILLRASVGLATAGSCLGQ